MLIVDGLIVKKPWLVLKEGLSKKNIDGEALTWAYGRLNLRREKDFNCYF